MRPRVRISHLADADLQDIHIEGIRHFGEGQADSYYWELTGTFELIGSNPRMGRSADQTYRVHAHRSHVVIYRIIDPDEIEISRVLHARQDWQHLLRRQ